MAKITTWIDKNRATFGYLFLTLVFIGGLGALQHRTDQRQERNTLTACRALVTTRINQLTIVEELISLRAVILADPNASRVQKVYATESNNRLRHVLEDVTIPQCDGDPPLHLEERR